MGGLLPAITALSEAKLVGCFHPPECYVEKVLVSIRLQYIFPQSFSSYYLYYIEALGFHRKVLHIVNIFVIGILRCFHFGSLGV